MRSRRGQAGLARGLLRGRYGSLWESLPSYPTDEEVIRAIRSVPRHHSGITFAQAAGQGYGNVSSGTVALTGVTSDNLLIAGVSMFNSNSLTASLSDDQGSGWAQLGSYGSGSGFAVGAFWRKATFSGTINLTVTPSSSAFLGLGLLEYSGADTASPQDGASTNNNVGATGTALSTGSVAVNAANELVLGFFGQGTGNISLSSFTGYNLRVNQPNGASQQALYVLDAIVSSATNVQATAASNVLWDAVGVSIKVGSGGGGGGGPWPWFFDQSHSGGFWDGGL